MNGVTTVRTSGATAWPVPADPEKVLGDPGLYVIHGRSIFEGPAEGVLVPVSVQGKVENLCETLG